MTAELRITDTLGVSAQELIGRQRSIIIGLSLGNRYFLDMENVERYLRWGSAHTKDRLTVLIPDQLHAINLRYKNSRTSPGKALRRAQRDAQRMQGRVEQIRSVLPVVQQNRLDVIFWDQVVCNSRKARKNIEAMHQQFESDKKVPGSGLYGEVMALVDSYLLHAGRAELSQVRREGLCGYFLQEAAILVGGVEYRCDGRSQRQDLFIYPSLGAMQSLITEIQSGDRFASLRESLVIEGEIAFAELR